MCSSPQSAAALSPPINRSITKTLNSLLKTRRFTVDIVLPYETRSLFLCLTFGVHSNSLFDAEQGIVRSALELQRKWTP